MHNFFKEKMKFLVTDTVDGPDESSKCIRVRVNFGKQGNGRGSRKRKDRSGKPFDSRGSDDWSGSKGKFLRYQNFFNRYDVFWFYIYLFIVLTLIQLRLRCINCKYILVFSSGLI